MNEELWQKQLPTHCSSVLQGKPFLSHVTENILTDIYRLSKTSPHEISQKSLQLPKVQTEDVNSKKKRLFLFLLIHYELLSTMVIYTCFYTWLLKYYDTFFFF